jgi:hypothetical protein
MGFLEAGVVIVTLGALALVIFAILRSVNCSSCGEKMSAIRMARQKKGDIEGEACPDCGTTKGHPSGDGQQKERNAAKDKAGNQRLPAGR